MPALFFLALLALVFPTSKEQEETIKYDELNSDTSDIEFVVPVETDWFGNDLTARPRTKRDTNHHASRHFRLHGFGEKFHLDLQPSLALLAPGFKVYHRQNFRTVKEDVMPEKDLDCLFVGTSRTHRRSTVALNICDGLTGLIQTSSESYLIQPTSEDDSRKHVLRKRSLTSYSDAIDTLKKPGIPKKAKVQTHYCGKKRRYMPRKPPKKNHWLPDEFQVQNESSRVKRSARMQQEPTRSVETLVVADREMVLKHGAENVTTYVLTVFNMVAMLYQDSTIGNNVSVILVGLVLLEGEEPGLSLSHNAEQSLSSFCQWQSTIHTSTGSQHDHAVLVTGKDICSWKEGPCDTLGYAPISGMCSKYRSCTVNEDSGLALAFTIAHEIGHNFGMVHDGQGHSSCSEVRGTIMSPSLSGLDSAFLWSPCSQRDLANFLKSSRAYCLNNVPDFPGQLKFPDVLPGQLYDGDMQCMFQFGTRSKLCRHYANTEEICKALWCENGRKCETKFLPAAEGTVCGKNKWCRKGGCISQESENVVPIHGGWSVFTEWSNCTVRCGNGGLRHRERHCNSPSPRNGGNYCKGKAKEYSICTTKDCPIKESDRQQDHCATFNQRTVKGKHYQWKPYSKDLGALARCRIYCAPHENDLYLVLSTKLPDGTSCQGNYSSVCVDGECKAVGCDGKIDSDVMPDLCGICNGDNSTCRVVSGKFVASNLSRGYHEVVKIPQGSRHINVSETKDYPTYLSLKNTLGHFYLNGNWAVHWPGRYMAGGTVFSYRRWPGQAESFISKGPVSEQLIVEVLVQEGQRSEINYNFVISTLKRMWRFTNSSCSATCGKGVITSSPRCSDESNNIVDSSQCDYKKPVTQIHNCYSHCHVKWHASPWSECLPSECGKTSWKSRELVCVREDRSVDSHLCKSLKKPHSKQRCPTKQCDGIWLSQPWLPCYGDCPWGVQRRLVLCKEKPNGSPEVNVSCDAASRPPGFRKCRRKDCSFKPKLYGVWQKGHWSSCSVTCGSGLQIRNVTCVASGGDIKSHFKALPVCNDAERPISSTPCAGTPCNSHIKDCKDRKTWCKDVVNVQLCQLPFYIRNCCGACAIQR